MKRRSLPRGTCRKVHVAGAPTSWQQPDGQRARRRTGGILIAEVSPGGKQTMMTGAMLLAAVTVLYAGYNLFIKISGGHVPATATTTILATICIQVAALATSLLFLAALAARGSHVFSLSAGSYLWALVAGICIGGAEIGYLYLFGGIGLSRPMAASIAIPTIVSGTVVIAMIAAHFALDEPLAWTQIVGAVLILLGVLFLFIDTQGSH